MPFWLPHQTVSVAVGTGAVGMVVRLTDMAAPFMLLWAEDTPWAPGVLLGCLCCLASLSIWLLPETRHRGLPDTLQEIQAWKRKEDPRHQCTAVNGQRKL
ncbi:hypothetical protein ACOMHN_034647 [Nucella lapillus]